MSGTERLSSAELETLIERACDALTANPEVRAALERAPAAVRASVRTVLGSSKGTTIIWAPDGRRFAYAKDGKLYTHTALGAGTPTLLAGGDSLHARPGDSPGRG